MSNYYEKSVKTFKLKTHLENILFVNDYQVHTISAQL